MSIEKGESIALEATFYDWTNTKANPVEVRLVINDERGKEQLNTTDLANPDVGTFRKIWTISSDIDINAIETWIYRFIGTWTDNTVSIQRGSFEVFDPLVQPHYTTPYDVSYLLQRNFSPQSEPSIHQVIRMIMNSERVIDQYCNTTFSLKTETDLVSLDTREPLERFSLLGWRRWKQLTLSKDPLYEVIKIERRYGEGGEWTDITADEDEQWRVRDGSLDVRVYRYPMEFRVQYKWGYPEPPYDIKECCAKMVAKDLLVSEGYSNITTSGLSGIIDLRGKAEIFERDIKEILSRYKEVKLL